MESLVKMFFSVLSHFTGGQSQGGGSLCYTGTNDPHPQASVILWWQAPYRIRVLWKISELLKNEWIFKNLTFIFERERERKRPQMGVGQRERGIHRIWSRFQALSCQHRAQCRPWTPMLRDHDLSRSQMLNRLSHPGAPSPVLLDSHILGFP